MEPRTPCRGTGSSSRHWYYQNGELVVAAAADEEVEKDPVKETTDSVEEDPVKVEVVAEE